MATAALLKERNREMSGMQAFLSLVLFSSRVEKKVCMYMYVCVHACTLAGISVVCMADNVSEQSEQDRALLLHFSDALLPSEGV